MKRTIKEPFLKKRGGMSRDEVLEKSGKIKKSLFGLRQYKSSETVMFFVSFKNEVFTHDMIKEALMSKKVVVPKVADGEIKPSAIKDFKSLVPSGRFGLLQPAEPSEVDLKDIDLVLVPGIVFGMKGHRIGYGHGYYDRLLKKIPKALKAGIAFDFQIVEELQTESHDVPVDMIITEKRIIRCKNNFL